MIMNDKISFLYASISDVQSTIRAIDTKIGILILFIFFPLTNITKVFTQTDNIININPSWYIYLTVMIFFFSWAASTIISIRAISAVDNPSDHIINSNEYSGVFYSGHLYEPEITDAIFNRIVLKATKDVTGHFNSIPDDINMIAKELTFEQMKLIYIRDIKLNRLKWSLNFTYIWLVFGLIVYLISHYK